MTKDFFFLLFFAFFFTYCSLIFSLSWQHAKHYGNVWKGKVLNGKKRKRREKLKIKCKSIEKRFAFSREVSLSLKLTRCSKGSLLGEGEYIYSAHWKWEMNLHLLRKQMFPHFEHEFIWNYYFSVSNENYFFWRPKVW